MFQENNFKPCKNGLIKKDMYVFKIRIIRLKNCSKTWAGLKYGCVETCNGTWAGLKGGWVETCNRRCIERWNGLKHGVG